MDDKFNLSRKDYQSNVIKSFSSLRHDDNLNDVSLVSDDNVQIFAHKVVLSSCSGYFKDIFIKNRQPHPFLCLIGVNSQEVNNVLDYIYKGEVLIGQDKLDKFLEVAKKFQLEGLRLRHSETKINVDNFKREIKEVEIPSFPYINEVVSHKNIGSLSETAVVSDMSSNIEELDSTIENEISRTSDGFWQCRRCPQITKKKSNIKEHVVSHIEGLSFPCQSCGKKCRSRQALRFHHQYYQKYKSTGENGCLKVKKVLIMS